MLCHGFLNPQVSDEFAIFVVSNEMVPGLSCLPRIEITGPKMSCICDRGIGLHGTRDGAGSMQCGENTLTYYTVEFKISRYLCR